MSKIDILVGLQYGNESKGKIIDILSPEYDIIVKYQGGPSTNYTIVYQDKTYNLSYVSPSIFYDDKLIIIGNNVIIDPITFVQEIKNLEEAIPNIKSRIVISNKACLLLPSHILLNNLINEKENNRRSVEYMVQCDKYKLDALKISDIFKKEFPVMYNKLFNKHAQLMKFYDSSIDIKKTLKHIIEVETSNFIGAVDYIKEFQIGETEYIINTFIKNNVSILAECNNGTLQDIDFGHYPDTYNYHTIASNACICMGIPPKYINEIYGVFKPYITSSNNIHFSTVQNNRLGKLLQAIGNEYDTISNINYDTALAGTDIEEIDRNCGWLDLVALKYSCMINGITKLIITKTDILDTFKEFKLCISYTDNDNIEFLTYTPNDIQNYKPNYITLKGWKTDTTEITEYIDMPDRYKEFISYIEYYIELPITIISNNADKNLIIKK